MDGLLYNLSKSVFSEIFLYTKFEETASDNNTNYACMAQNLSVQNGAQGPDIEETPKNIIYMYLLLYILLVRSIEFRFVQMRG